MASQLKALIWDCDGVLAETEKDGHRVAFNRIFADEGWGISWDVQRYGEMLKVAGGKERMKAQIAEAGFSLPREVGDVDAYVKGLHRRKTDLYMELVEQGKLPIRPGVVRLMTEAHQRGVRLAIASTSNVRGVTLIARQLGDEIFGWIEHICAGDMAKKKKPAPDIYNLAIERLGIAASEALVIEDTGHGVTAGVAAGCQVLVTRSEYSKGEDFPEAVLQVDSLGDQDAVDRVTIDQLMAHYKKS